MESKLGHYQASLTPLDQQRKRHASGSAAIEESPRHSAKPISARSLGAYIALNVSQFERWIRNAISI
jgi:hypothetical protein